MHTCSLAAKLCMGSLAMKLLIAVALLVVGLSPSTGFIGEGSGQTTDATTQAAPTRGVSEGTLYSL